MIFTMTEWATRQVVPPRVPPRDGFPKVCGSSTVGLCRAGVTHAKPNVGT